MQGIAGAPVSGEEFGVPGVSFPSQGPIWPSGGRLRPGGGVGATIATGAALAILTVYGHRRGFFKKYRP
jgi:hypothetical protein